VLVRQESPKDYEAVRVVHGEAFARADPHVEVAGEVVLTDELRQSRAFIPELSLVALVDTEVVGHVIVTRATVGPQRSGALGLGPLGVRVAHQRHGVGRALIERVIDLVDALGEPVIVLLGDPHFYGRFGFDLASKIHIDPPNPQWAPHFLARKCRMYDPTMQGRFTYAEPFDRL